MYIFIRYTSYNLPIYISLLLTKKINMVYLVHITTKTTAVLTIGQCEWLVLVQLVCCSLVRLMSQYANSMYVFDPIPVCYNHVGRIWTVYIS